MVDMGNAPRDTTLSRRPKVAVVIGGGGLKSLAAIALFEFLSDAQIDIDLLVGCSGGGIMAALRGAGYDSTQMRDSITQSLNKKLFRKIDYRSIAGIAKLPFGRFDKSSGILKPDPIRRVYRRVFGDLRLEDLQPETVLQATDYQTGEGVVLNTGLVADAVYASAALSTDLPMSWKRALIPVISTSALSARAIRCAQIEHLRQCSKRLRKGNRMDRPVPIGSCDSQ